MEAQYLQGQGHTDPKKVWYSGSDAVQRGIALCYDRTVGTATNKDERRDTYVAKPSATNCTHFAGVATHTYSAVTGGQVIEIWEPDSVCEVACVASATTVGVTRLGYLLTTGLWIENHRTGPGTALAIQTSSSPCLAQNIIAGGTYTTADKTLTDSTKDFTALGVAAGDIIVVIGGALSGVTAGTSSTVATVGTTTLTVAANIASNNGVVHYAIYRETPPRVLAKLGPAGFGGGTDTVFESGTSPITLSVAWETLLYLGNSFQTNMPTAYVGAQKLVWLTGAASSKNWTLYPTDLQQCYPSPNTVTCASGAANDWVLLKSNGTLWTFDSGNGWAFAAAT